MTLRVTLVIQFRFICENIWKTRFSLNSVRIEYTVTTTFTCFAQTIREQQNELFVSIQLKQPQDTDASHES